eukprot:UN27794
MKRSASNFHEPCAKRVPTPKSAQFDEKRILTRIISHSNLTRHMPSAIVSILTQNRSKFCKYLLFSFIPSYSNLHRRKY